MNTDEVNTDEHHILEDDKVLVGVQFKYKRGLLLIAKGCLALRLQIYGYY